MTRSIPQDAPWELPQFAYGVNTNIDHLRDRCPGWTGAFTTATLPDYRMRFNKAYPGAETTYCNIEPREGSVVHGVLLWLDRESFLRVDSYEGFPRHYQRRLVVATDDQGIDQLAWAYYSQFVDNRLRPSDHYLENVIAGLRAAKVPAEYLSEVLGSIPPERPRRGRRRSLAMAGR